MGFHYGTERKKLDTRWHILRVEYAEAGMSEEAMDKLYRFDLDELNSNRRYANHTQAFADVEEAFGRDRTSLMDKFLHVLAVHDTAVSSTSRHWWIEELEDPVMYQKAKALNEADLELITRYVFEGYTQTEIARYFGISQKNISKKWTRLEKYFSEGV